jgi:hypothetical protein
MSRQPAFRKSLPFAAIVLSAVVLAFAMQEAGAQQPNNGAGSGQAPRGYYVQRGQPAVGGYSLRLSDIWGPAKMPPAPKDFGPHFDFPPEPLNGGLLHDPYPN